MFPYVDHHICTQSSLQYIHPNHIFLATNIFSTSIMTSLSTQNPISFMHYCTSRMSSHHGTKDVEDEDNNNDDDNF